MDQDIMRAFSQEIQKISAARRMETRFDLEKVASARDVLFKMAELERAFASGQISELEKIAGIAMLRGIGGAMVGGAKALGRVGSRALSGAQQGAALGGVGQGGRGMQGMMQQARGALGGAQQAVQAGGGLGGVGRGIQRGFATGARGSPTGMNAGRSLRNLGLGAGAVGAAGLGMASMMPGSNPQQPPR